MLVEETNRAEEVGDRGDAKLQGTKAFTVQQNGSASSTATIGVDKLGIVMVNYMSTMSYS
jgi:hypothetical protein